MNSQVFLKPAKKVVSLATTTWRKARTPAEVASLADFPDPAGKQLADVLRCMRAAEFDQESKKWIEKIEAKRREMLVCNAPLVQDSSVEPGPYDLGSTVSSACKVSKSQQPATLLHLLIREFQPTTAVELGTNVGISSAYQAAAMNMNGKGHLVTLEASPYRARQAENLHKSLGLENVTYVLGYFAETLDNVLSRLKTVDYAFIDGHHQLQPTLDYFDKIWPHTSENAVVVFDDIRWSDGMKQAWKILKQDPRMKISVDLYSVGICITTRAPLSNKTYKVPVIHLGR